MKRFPHPPLIILILFLLASGCASKKNGDTTLYFYQGTVTVNGQAVSQGMILPPGALIKTGKDSLCDILFGEKNIIRLRSESSITLQKPGGKRGPSLDSGSALGVFRGLKKKRTYFALRTPTSVAAVRGTTFFVHVGSPDSSYICLCNGKLAAGTGNHAHVRDLRAPHHKAVAVTKKKNASCPEISSAKMLYHTDKDMEEVAAQISETIDWSKVEE